MLQSTNNLACCTLPQTRHTFSEDFNCPLAPAPKNPESKANKYKHKQSRKKYSVYDRNYNNQCEKEYNIEKSIEQMIKDQFQRLKAEQKDINSSDRDSEYSTPYSNQHPSQSRVLADSEASW